MSRPIAPPRPNDKRQARLSFFHLSARQPLPSCKVCGVPTANLKTLICQPCKKI